MSRDVASILRRGGVEVGAVVVAAAGLIGLGPASGDRLAGLLAATVAALVLACAALLAARMAARRKNDSLAQHNRMLRAVTDHVPGMVGYWDHALVCRFANLAYLEWYGKLPDDAIGRPMREILGEELFRSNEPFARAALDGLPQRFERVQIKPSGEVGHTWVQYIPDRVDGDVRGFTVLVTDVTELQTYRVRLEQVVASRTAELQESEARFRQVVHSLPQLVWTCTADGACDFLSDSWIEFTGVPLEAQLGADWLQVVHPDDRAELMRRWQASVGSGAPFEVEFRIRRRDGVYRWFDTRAAPLRDAGGAIVKWFGSNTDIDDRKRLAAELRRHTDELERSNASLERFAWAASHDLQEPLRMVASFTQMLQRRYGDRLDDQGRVMMDHVVDGARRMQALVSGLLQFSRVGGGAPEGGVDMSANALRAAELLADAARDAGASVTIEAEMPAAPLDPAEAVQLWLNLLGNAIKYRGPTPPRVHAGVRRPTDGDPVYYVADDGPGIAERHHDRVFQIFQRLEVDPARRHDGAGIGLALCRRIVEAAGGRIWVESDGSTGSTFCFTVPGRRGGRP